MARPKPHHYHPMVRALAKALRQRCHVQPGASIVVACSGGADSVALLRGLALLATRRTWQLKLTVAHIQHHLREEAEDDAIFVQALAKQLGLAFVRRDIRPAQSNGNLEANARHQRYAALAEVAQAAHASFVATAHHADDQLETLLMRLLRGSSVAGLRGIAWHMPNAEKAAATQKVSDTFSLIRPMLGVEQSEILALLHQLEQPWREDTTNTDTTRTRAKLRHDILPLLRQLQPDAASKASALAEHFGDLYALLQNAATQVPQRAGASSGVLLMRAQARSMNRAVLAEVLRRALNSAGVPSDQLSRHALQPAIHAAQDNVGGTRSFTFSNHVTITITRETLTLQSATRSC